MAGVGMLLILTAFTSVHADCTHITDIPGKPEGYAAFGSNNVVELCELDDVSTPARGLYYVLFDKDLRIPLVAQTHLSQDEIQARSPGRDTSASFMQSRLVTPNEQAYDSDYRSSKYRISKYEEQTSGQLVDDVMWKNPEGAGSTSRGHLIADQYIKDPTKKPATYRFTNAVPQFSRFNSGPWSVSESALMTWARTQCQGGPMGNEWHLYITVGVVPAKRVSDQRLVRMMGTCAGGNRNFYRTLGRWMGRHGYGDGEFDSTLDYGGNSVPATDTSAYRVNVPLNMWTTACCVNLDPQNNVAYARNTAFGRANVPLPGATCPMVESEISNVLNLMVGVQVRVFPNIAECSDNSKYVPLHRQRGSQGRNSKSTWKRTNKGGRNTGRYTSH